MTLNLTPENGKISYISRLVKIDNEEFSMETKDRPGKLHQDMEDSRLPHSQDQEERTTAETFCTFYHLTLQQEASRRLGYTAKRTMALAQQLYEGMDVGDGGSVGLITYMRTDSTNISPNCNE